MQNVTRKILLNNQYAENNNNKVSTICQNEYSFPLFPYTFFPIFAHFSRDTSKSGFGDRQKWEKMGLNPPKFELGKNGVEPPKV